MNEYALFGFKPFRSKEFWEEGYHSVISEEETVFFEKEAAGFKRFVFAFELRDAYDAGDEFNVMALEQVFELPLRVFCYKADGSRARIDKGVYYWSADSGIEPYKKSDF